MGGAGRSGGLPGDGDAYEVLGIGEGASEKEIQAAYRKGSVKCHPDKNPDDPEAPAKFDRLTRAKDLLLDPVRRAELDRHKKAKRDLEERFSQEDGKRRKLREELEQREDAAAARDAAAQARSKASEDRKRAVQIDFASRIRAKEADIEARQAEVTSRVAGARAAAAEARLRIKWRRTGAPDADAIAQALRGFDVRSVEVEDAGATVQMASREEALRAVLHYRERRQQLPFSAALATAARPQAPPRAAAPPQPAPPREAPRQPDPAERPLEGGAKKEDGPRAATGASPSSFEAWEAEMLASLQGLAATQKAAAPA